MFRTPRADQYTFDDLKASADIIEAIDELNSYVGFFSPGGELSDTEKEAAPVCSIMKITQSQAGFPNTTGIKYAEGIFSFSHIWNNRAAYNYKYKNF